jgi:hypothetical protein
MMVSKIMLMFVMVYYILLYMSLSSFLRFTDGQTRYKYSNPLAPHLWMFVPMFLMLALKLIGDYPTLVQELGTGFCLANGLYFVGDRAFSTRGGCNTDDLGSSVYVLLL